MANIERDVGIVAGFLSAHRLEPPERDGWYSMYEIESGIRRESGRSFRSYRVLLSVDFLMDSDPPAVEDTWMLVGEDRLPMLDQQFEHPEKPKGARRYYRALGNIGAYESVIVLPETFRFST